MESDNDNDNSSDGLDAPPLPRVTTDEFEALPPIIQRKVSLAFLIVCLTREQYIAIALHKSHCGGPGRVPSPIPLYGPEHMSDPSEELDYRQAATVTISTKG